VLLHGVGANSMHWRFQLAGLSDRFHVVAWNAPGYILSDGLKTETPTCRDFADALNDFLASLKLDRVDVLANSFGTRVAQCFAIHYPGRIIRLAMTGTGIGPHGLSDDEKKKVIATREAQIAKGGYGFGTRANALVGPGASPQTIALVQDVVRATNPRGFMHGVKLGLVDGYSPDEVAGHLTFPVLLISGSADKVNPIDKNAAILVKVLKQGRLEVLDGYGHLPEVEAPETVNKLLRDFFAE
jgi:pimeloyl-ACP methyl ester carboxylesterase